MIQDHVGKRVRFRPSFVNLEAVCEGVFVAYAENPQAIINMDDGTQMTVDARLLVSVERTGWESIR